jgi:hypothetical protein
VFYKSTNQFWAGVGVHLGERSYMHETARSCRYFASCDVIKPRTDRGFRDTHLSGETSVNTDGEPTGTYPRQDPQGQCPQNSRHTGQLW